MIVAFSLANDLRPSDLQFFHGLADEPVDSLTAKLALTAHFLATRLEAADPVEMSAIGSSLERLRSTGSLGGVAPLA